MAKGGHFRLFDLPDEIWVKIAKYAVDLTPKRPQEQLGYCWPELIRQPAVTRACHSLRVELLPYFYGNHIKLFLYGGDEEDVNVLSGSLCVWLSAIGTANLKMMRCIRLFIEERYVEEAISQIRIITACPPVVGEQMTELDEDEKSFLWAGEKVYPLRFV
ncbi:hypothetical protein LTR97_011502 [Elasticomyces elasticus]|uniref:F-box domain-containing protein n=1 Tax=Elasticomyces elasticus TaxID=574655 RepID=A0AAN7VMQ2_9PEZI|nr:hypothetical protein LTR97_011502 [Elasticomyces elasticus]